jgi:MraZ protein
MNFLGTNNLNLDGKHRMSMPSRYRERIKDLSGGNMVVSPAAPLIVPGKDPQLEPCLWLYTSTEWETVMQQVMALPSTNAIGRMMHRQFLGNAEEVSLDAGGRVLLPARLREYAGIEKNIVLIGQGKKFEIWDEAKLDSQSGWDVGSEVATEQVVAQLNQLAL